MTQEFVIGDQSGVASARRGIAAFATAMGFPASDAGRVSLVVTELATNILKHAGTGSLLAGLFDDDTGQGVEVLSLDGGPGMTDVGACLADGYSTAGSAGNGLGAVQRQADQFDLRSWPGAGTVVLARFLLKPSAGAGRWPDCSALAVPKAGEEVCGDAWAVSGQAGQRVLLVADGLGHGPEAAQASVEAVRIFRDANGQPPEAMLQRMHLGLRHTRGAAASLAVVDSQRGEVRFGGIGNVSGALVGQGRTRRMISHNGTLGHNLRKVQAIDYQFEDGLVILHSDGLSSSWSFDRYPGLWDAHPSTVAGVLLRDCARGRDDATVLVCRSTPL